MIGHTLSNRYELLARVGGGGMALVYKARDLLLNRFVAVKVLRQQFTHDEDFVRRFRREAQAAASLSHSNIVSIYDVGQVEDTHYIVMEFIDGANLNEIIRDRAPLQAEEAVRITAQICDALDHAHHNQIIHRDIKPHNILIGNNGRVKVTDFGIARAVTSSTITQTGSVIGSVHYFSPEHAKGVATGEKSDLYSLGIVLYQMMTGRLPFLGESPISVALKHLQEPFEQPRKVNPYIPQSVENIILRAMRKNPQERYGSAKEMLLDLETCLRPQRLNEPAVKYLSDEEDENRTKVIPAIRSDMLNTMEAPAIKAGNPNNTEQWNSEGLDERKRKWIMPTVLGVFAILLIGVLIWAVSALKGQMPDDVLVPDVVGQTEVAAKDMLIAAGFTIADPIIYEETEDKDAGNVIAQDKANMEAKEGAEIQLTVGKKKVLPLMPDLRGKSFEDARDYLKETLGVNKNNILSHEINDNSEPGTVLDQFPKQDAPFDPSVPDMKITLTISKGEEAFPMPKLIGDSLDVAKAKIEKANLKLPADNIHMETSYTPKGEVFKQFPADENEMVTAQQEVSIWISSGYPKDSKTQPLDVTVSPAIEGESSRIIIKYTDARGDNIEGVSRKISSTTSIPITLILSPTKDGIIYIFRDGQLIQTENVPYLAIPATSLPVVPVDSGGGTDSGEVPPSDEGTDPADEGTSNE